jgi:glycosyltransferase involved in cell wall biosynthesis
MKMDQLIAFYLADLRGGGAQRVMVNLANGFLDYGYDVDFVLAHATGEMLSFLDPRVRVVNLSCERVRYAVPRLARYLTNRAPTCLISGLPRVNLSAIVANEIARKKTKVIVTVHGSRPIIYHARSSMSQGVLRLERWLYPRAHSIVAVSKGTADDLAKNTGLSRKKIQVIANPAVTKAIFDSADEVVNDHPIEDAKRKIILGIGRLSMQKNFSVLIKAFGLLRNAVGAKLIILGEGEERPTLNAIIKDLDLTESVCLPGFVSNPFAYLRRADLFVLSSRFEGLPTVLLEAMALGVPVVSTNCRSGPEEILENGRYGYLVPVDDVQSLATTMLKALNNPIREGIVQRALEYTPDAVVPQYLDLLRK